MLEVMICYKRMIFNDTNKKKFLETYIGEKMSKYIDAKVRVCPKCYKNTNYCQCQESQENNQVQFVELSQAKYDELVQKEQQEQE